MVNIILAISNNFNQNVSQNSVKISRKVYIISKLQTYFRINMLRNNFTIFDFSLNFNYLIDFN